MSPTEIGKRLVEFRKTLTRDTGEEWTQPRIAQELGLSQNAIHRLEHGSGSMENLSRLLDFYHNKGYNVQWVMVSDNSKVRMYLDDKASDQEVMQSLQNLTKIIISKFA